ncbi:hypothetical protein FRC03_004242 [Tulasnella sp. 419]|nr:hypothetical protein FRC03_004242 [Tulasnella sp. 419]
MYLSMLKLLPLVFSLSSPVVAQYAWSGFSSSGITVLPVSNQCIRPTANGASPLGNVNSVDIRCGAGQAPAPTTCTIQSGSTASFHLTAPISHPGVLNIYLGRVPSGGTAANWSGAGTFWFKVKQISAVVNPSTGSASWPVLGQQVIPFVVPAALPPGQYLARAEYINLVSAATTGGARFHVGCAQLNIVSRGSTNPGPLVPIPGVYTPTHPGILIDISLPMTSYTQPGPPVWP